MKIHAGRQVARASNGMVTSPHVLASRAGIDVLRAGGSAVDAALAASAVLTVVYPHMTSIGGDAFWLIHEGDSGSIKYLSGGGRAAATATIDWFDSRGIAEIPFRGVVPATLTVPGAVASWIEAHRRYGRLPLKKVLEAAISYAREGFPATSRLAAFVRDTRDELKKSPHAAAIFFVDGEPLKEGQRLVNGNLARSLDLIAHEGHDGFYAGPIAREMAQFAKEHGGFFRMADFKLQKAKWGEPLTGSYRDVLVYNTPPPTQGFTVIEMLNLIERYDIGRFERLGPDHVHLLVQAKQVAYNDRDAALADPDYADVPIERLLSKDYANERAKLIKTRVALAWDKVPSYGSLTGDTVYVAAIDSEGNATSLIQSLYGVFGACVIAGDTGIVLQNRGAYFSLDFRHPNRLEPGKVPLHTLIASMAKRDGKLWSVFGCMGADGQPQIQLQAYVAMIDFGLNVQEAIEAPRFLSGRFALGEVRDTLHIEARFPKATFEELEHRGHILHRWGDWNEYAGHAHGILVDAESGTLLGGSDPRSDGAAIGY
jgi:gamma-glutamyltranspeptidase/glutathione hydrolase